MTHLAECDCGLCNPPESFEDVFEALAKEATDLLVQKQRGYGPKNIEELGFHGVFSRLASDKINRLRNLMNGSVVKGQVVLDFTDGDLTSPSRTPSSTSLTTP